MQADAGLSPPAESQDEPEQRVGPPPWPSGARPLGAGLLLPSSLQTPLQPLLLPL